MNPSHCQVLLLIVFVFSQSFVACSQVTAGSLRLVVVITRHGDRTPIVNFANSLSCKLQFGYDCGQLTGEGMWQHFQLGQLFRKRYIEEKRFLSPTYDMGEVSVRATAKERTLMSAQSFMLGMFPPGTGPRAVTINKTALPFGIQPVPIHSVDGHHDILLRGYKICPRLKELRKDLKTSKEWKQKEIETREFRRRLSEIFGKQIELDDISALYHFVSFEELHNRRTPAGWTDELKNQLRALRTWVLQQKFKTREMGRLGAGNLLRELIRRMSEMQESLVKMNSSTRLEKQPKFILYSGHDDLILALLSAMGLQHYRVPEFAAYMVFEGHEFTNQFNISVMYDDAPLLIQCTPHCELQYFSNLMKDAIPQNWEDECQTPTKKSLTELFSLSTIGINISEMNCSRTNILVWLFGYACGIFFYRILQCWFSRSLSHHSKTKMS